MQRPVGDTEMIGRAIETLGIVTLAALEEARPCGDFRPRQPGFEKLCFNVQEDALAELLQCS